MPLKNSVYAKLEALEDLHDEEIARVAALLTDVRDIPKRRNIVSDGDRPRHVHLIVEGWAARYKITRGGARRITAILLPGDFCDLHVTALARMDHAIMALTPCRVAFIDQDMINAITRSTPTLTRALWRSTLIDEAILRQWLVSSGRRSAYEMVAHLLCELYERMDMIGLVNDGRFALPPTQEELADATALTPVHLNRILQQLRKQGLIELAQSSLLIPDIAALQKACGFDPSYLHRRSDIYAPGENAAIA